MPWWGEDVCHAGFKMLTFLPPLPSMQAAWGVAKAWVHPVTQAKINVLGKPSECAKRLEIEVSRPRSIVHLLARPPVDLTALIIITHH